MTASAEQASPGSDPGGSGATPSGRGRVPDFFIIGHEKCGTSALDLMLKEHPQIFMPAAKEQRFFAPELRGRRDNPNEVDHDRPRTFELYCEVFAPALPEQLVGEASPQYLRSRTAAGRIAEVRPDARMIAILREPASFLRSFHLQWVRNSVETERDFRKAIALEDDRRQGRNLPRGAKVPETLFYSDHVRYVQQLERYRAVFPAEQLLVLIYDDYRRDNEGTVRSVLRFLGVDEEIPVPPTETNSRKAVRSLYLKRLADEARIARRNPAAASRVGRTVAALTPEAMRSESFRSKWRKLVYKTPAPPDEEFTQELRRRFKGEVEALSEYLGRDMVREWGYDELA